MRALRILALVLVASGLVVEASRVDVAGGRQRRRPIAVCGAEAPDFGPGLPRPPHPRPPHPRPHPPRPFVSGGDLA